MPLQFAVRLRAFCVAVALTLATAPLAHAATAKDPLIGVTRDQVLEKLGEPKNTIVAGNREVLLFDRDRITLRDNVVITVEKISAEPVRRPPPAPAPVAPTEPATDQPAPAPAASAAKRHAAPAGDGGESGLPAVPAPPAASGGATAPATATSAAPVTPSAPDPNAPLEIKVRSGSAPRTTPTTTTSTAPLATPAPATKSATAEKSAAPAPTVAPATAPTAPVTTTTTPPATTPPLASVPAADATKAADAPTEAVAPTPTPEEVAAAAAEAEKEKVKAKAKASKTRRINAQGVEEDEPQLLTKQTYIVGTIAILAGAAFLVWRSRQRELELAATAVSRVPFSVPTASSSGGGGAIFTADVIAKLEWKRFEELVASYYSKTGVVAARTKTGPASPVHIKISWKGEPRPFALVQCLSHPTGLIDARPLQELVTVLAAEDIRRGYVVTTGKFNIPARDFAEEKHITLLPGDIFLEKINALPDAARNELMSEVTNGDFTTPSCPKCEAKMAKNPDDSTQWRCAAHPDQVIPVK